MKSMVLRGPLATRGLAFIACILALLMPAAHAQVTSLACSPTTIGGGSGASSTCTLTLGAAAPTGGTAVALSSSLSELAASVPSITVPAGQTVANFTVATNPLYRHYSGLAFTATITASANATSRSVPLNVTAQARPTTVVLNPDTTFRGPTCTGEQGVLFDCQGGTGGTCSFLQQCTLGCLDRPQSGGKSTDMCATTGPFPISLNPKTVVGGNSSAGTLHLSAAAPAGSFGLVASSSLVAAPENRLNMPIPTGATSLGFKVLTAPVNAIQFANMDARITTPEPHPQGGTFFASNNQRTWIAVTPGTRPPVNLTTLTLEVASLRGGDFTSGTACINQLKPAPAVGNVALAITSSNTQVATIGTQSFPEGNNCSVFGIQTAAVSTNTIVTITAQLGTQSLTSQLTVQAAASATSVNSFFLDPFDVVGGNPSTGTVVLNGLAPAGGSVVTLTSNNTAVVVLPSSVTVPAGSDRVSFVVSTNPVATSTTVGLTATYGISAFTSLIVTPAAATGPLPAPTLLSPADAALFGRGDSIRFDWSDVANAASYTIEIDDSSAIAAPLITTQTTTVSETTISSLPRGNMWWRVRANSTDGTAGTWSVVRQVEIN